VKIKYFPDKHF